MKLKHLNLGAFVLAVCLLLAGCSVRKNLSNSELDKEYNNDSQAVIVAHAMVAKQEANSKNANKPLSLSSQNEKILADQYKTVNQSVKKVNKSNLTSKYPKTVLSYVQSCQAYLKLIQKKGTLNQEKAVFHDVDSKSTSVYLISRDQSKIRDNFQNLLSIDGNNGYRSVDGHKIESTNSQKKVQIKNGHVIQNEVDDQNSGRQTNKTPVEGSLPNGSSQPTNTINLRTNYIRLNIGESIVLVIISLVIILVVFEQPNKSNDQMNALTDTGGASLFNEASLHGYDLFLYRVTEISIAVLAIILIWINVI